MRVALISTPFLAVPPRDYGGTELVVYELAEGLKARGHDVTVFGTGDSTTSAELRSLYDRAQWPPEMLTDVSHVSWAMREVAAGGYDLVHTHSCVALALQGFVPDVPLVYTLHHVRDERLSAFYDQYPEAFYVAISDDQRRREHPLPRVSVIHHGLDSGRYTWTSAPRGYVTFVGRLSLVKGPHTAIDVAARAGVRIVVAGDVHPPDRDFAEREVVPRLQRAHVAYIGRIGMSVKVPLLRDARALLAPIDWDEPFGLILIEAMLSGCPVVAFPRGSVPELIEHGVTGFIAGSSDEMADVIRPGGPLERFDRAACRTRAVERFSRARMVLDHERLYARIVSQTRDTSFAEPRAALLHVPAPTPSGAEHVGRVAGEPLGSWA
jgi:glycosyltransferase involved in cell wall biosynthesis